MALTDIWFLLIAVLWTGYFVLEGFDFGVGMLLPVRRPRPRPTAGVADQHHRPGLGRQRGVAARRRRRDLRRVPRVVRHPVLRLLPAAAAHPGRADRARGRLRVPRQDRQRPLAAQLGPRDRRRLGACPRCCGASRSRTSCAACRSTPTTSTPARFFDLLNPYALLGGLTTLSLFALHGAVFLALKTDGDVRARADALAARLGVRRDRARRRVPGLDAVRPRRRCWTWSAGAGRRGRAGRRRARRDRRAARAGRSCSRRWPSSPSR